MDFYENGMNFFFEKLFKILGWSENELLFNARNLGVKKLPTKNSQNWAAKFCKKKFKCCLMLGIKFLVLPSEYLKLRWTSVKNALLNYAHLPAIFLDGIEAWRFLGTLSSVNP